MTISGLMTNSGDARNKLSIINCLLYNICAAKERTCLWTYFLSAIERAKKMWDLHSFLVELLPYDSLKWIKYVQIFHLYWHVYRDHFLKIWENISKYIKSGPLPTYKVYSVSNINTLVIKFITVASMNWVCNNVTTVYICYTSIILHLYFAQLSLYCMDHS